MSRIPEYPFDPAVSEVIGEILMVALVVALASIVSAFMMGVIGSVPDTAFTAFKADPIYNNTTKIIDAVSVLCMAGEGISGRSGESAGPGAGNELKDMSIHISPPDGSSHTVSLCAAIGSAPFRVGPGTQIFIVKRGGTYFFVNNPGQSGCGDGGGGNQELKPHGLWTITIAETLKSNTVVYKGEVWL